MGNVDRADDEKLSTKIAGTGGGGEKCGLIFKLLYRQ